jgi:phospholipase D1/2
MVFVMIPLLPGFTGDITNPQRTVLRMQVKHQQETIAKGKNSLFELLKDEGVDPDDYIRFYALRNHAVMSGQPVQEIIYVHSKFMIVDDRKFIIGSSNINDRSMLGDRDSEIGIVVEDGALITSTMANKEFKVGKIPHEFRVKIFMGKSFHNFRTLRRERSRER